MIIKNGIVADPASGLYEQMDILVKYGKIVKIAPDISCASDAAATEKEEIIDVIEDKSKALSYIGIEIAESLKDIENVEEVKNSNKENEESNVQYNAENQENIENTEYIEDTRVEVKPSLWERIKNMKLVRGIRYIMKIKVVLELPEMPELPSGSDRKD